MNIRTIALLALLACAPAAAQDQAATAEPSKIEYFECTNLMEKAVTAATMAYSEREQVEAMKDRAKALQCVDTLTPRIGVEERREGFLEVQSVWSVAISTPTAGGMMEYVMAAQKFHLYFE